MREPIELIYRLINPPLSHFLRDSVPGGNNNSGRYNTSTKRLNSDCTRGFNWSSSSDTISCNPSIMLLSKRINCEITTLSFCFTSCSRTYLRLGPFHFWSLRRLQPLTGLSRQNCCLIKHRGYLAFQVERYGNSSVFC